MCNKPDHSQETCDLGGSALRSEVFALDLAPRYCVKEIETRVEAADGFQLSARVFHPAVDALGIVVFNPGGGVAVDRYQHFLRHLASNRLAVIAYDYRGVGRSTPPETRKFDAGIEDWAELDQASVIRYACAQFPNKRITSVSHSIGCMIAAAAPDAHVFDQMVFVSPHTGYWGDYRRCHKWPMALLWHVAMPLIATLFGYFPASSLGLGDDFPRRFALQWAARLGPDFRFGAYGGNVDREYRLLDRMTSLRSRALVITAFDDCFATDTAIRRFLGAMPNVSSVRRDLGRQKEAAFGHWDFFRRRHSCHWNIASDFILQPARKYSLAPEWMNHTPS